MKRKSIVLLFTLLTLIVIFALVSKNLSITDSFLKHTNKSAIKIQINEILLDTINILKDAKKNLKGDFKLDNRKNIENFINLLNSVPIIPINKDIVITPPKVDYEQSGKIFIKHFSSLTDPYSVLNQEEINKNLAYKELFLQIALYCQLSDDYLLQTLLTKFQNTKLITSAQIDEIIEQYYNQTKDKNIFKFKKAVTHIDFKGVDKNYLSNPLEKLSEEGVFTEKDFKEKFNFKDSSNILKFKFDINGTVYEEDFKASFVFDFNKSTVSNIEIIF